MSHIVTIATKVKDHSAVLAACQRLELSEPVHGTATLFSSEASGLLVKLSEWVYPVVIDTVTGQVAYDNFEGSWGDPKQLDRFLQIYAVEKAKLEARKKGYSVSEQSLNDGSIKLQIIEAR
ncbi:hypothetical protein SAMN05444166_2509 [Singulisphaera sp. GP187]|uniref:hypothetical protein n=1 Tax=Singulisphaera sp. GP187 TaxID=1882752 RepID=UPI000927A917|nr:hypothetical protein [Singulisphaera sp. GP187]SIO11230.1 hypothetical protein SAMN05444166_2509 [Singulisphaera sp. GP187]